MKPFTSLTGVVLPLALTNVDTDQIIPKQFLKSLKRTGFGDYLFDAWRYLDEGSLDKTMNERKINYDFILNQPAFQDARILLALDNFGCGSSREHAVWALEGYGIRCVIAPSFADIFHNNCFKNGLLPIILDKKIIKFLFEQIEKSPGLTLKVDLETETITLPNKLINFNIEPFYKRCLLNGLDEIELTLAQADSIRAYEAKRKVVTPWLFTDIEAGS